MSHADGCAGLSSTLVRYFGIASACHSWRPAQMVQSPRSNRPVQWCRRLCRKFQRLNADDNGAVQAVAAAAAIAVVDAVAGAGAVVAVDIVAATAAAAAPTH